MPKKILSFANTLMIIYFLCAGYCKGSENISLSCQGLLEESYETNQKLCDPKDEPKEQIPIPTDGVAVSLSQGRLGSFLFRSTKYSEKLACVRYCLAAALYESVYSMTDGNVNLDKQAIAYSLIQKSESSGGTAPHLICDYSIFYKLLWLQNKFFGYFYQDGKTINFPVCFNTIYTEDQAGRVFQTEYEVYTNVVLNYFPIKQSIVNSLVISVQPTQQSQNGSIDGNYYRKIIEIERNPSWKKGEQWYGYILTQNSCGSNQMQFKFEIQKDGLAKQLEQYLSLNQCGYTEQIFEVSIEAIKIRAVRSNTNKFFYKSEDFDQFGDLNWKIISENMRLLMSYLRINWFSLCIKLFLAIILYHLAIYLLYLVFVEIWLFGVKQILEILLKGLRLCYAFDLSMRETILRLANEERIYNQQHYQ